MVLLLIDFTMGSACQSNPPKLPNAQNEINLTNHVFLYDIVSYLCIHHLSSLNVDCKGKPYIPN